MNSDYQDSVEQAGQIARSAIPLAAKHQLPINPIVYTVFYQHISRTNEELCRAFEELANKGSITKEQIEKIYQSHINLDDFQALESLKDALGELFVATRSNLGNAESESESYQQCLNSAANVLSENSNISAIKSIVNDLSSHTQSMRNTTLELRKELSEANGKIDQMHAEFKRVRHESVTDPLTGLKNRRAFDISLKQLTDKLKSSHEPLSLLIADLDHFKKINDQYGHITGDAVLKWVAKILKDSVRGNDVPARLGGEEFAILLPNTALAGGNSVAENIRKNISERRVKHANTSLGQITISIGVAEYKPELSSEEFVERADQALYQAKHAGRNRVMAFTQ